MVCGNFPKFNFEHTVFFKITSKLTFTRQNRRKYTVLGSGLKSQILGNVRKSELFLLTEYNEN